VTHPESFGGEFRKNELVRPYVLQPKETEKPEPEPPDVEAINREILGTHLRLRSATGLYGGGIPQGSTYRDLGAEYTGPRATDDAESWRTDDDPTPALGIAAVGSAGDGSLYQSMYMQEGGADPQYPLSDQALEQHWEEEGPPWSGKW